MATKNSPDQAPSFDAAAAVASMSDAELAPLLGSERVQRLLTIAAPELEVRAPEAMVRLKAPADFGGFSHDGHEYRAADGFVAVPESAVDVACAHGCTKQDRADA